MECETLHEPHIPRCGHQNIPLCWMDIRSDWHPLVKSNNLKSVSKNVEIKANHENLPLFFTFFHSPVIKHIICIKGLCPVNIVVV